MASKVVSLIVKSAPSLFNPDISLLMLSTSLNILDWISSVPPSTLGFSSLTSDDAAFDDATFTITPIIVKLPTTIKNKVSLSIFTPTSYFCTHPNSQPEINNANSANIMLPINTLPYIFKHPSFSIFSVPPSLSTTFGLI